MTQSQSPDEKSSEPKRSDSGFFDRPNTHRKIFFGLLGITALLLLVDPFIDKHPHFEFDGWFGFHAAYGFFAYVGIVTCAKGLRMLVKRKEDYYGE